MVLFGPAVRGAAALLLLYAAASKIAAPGPFLAALTALRLPAPKSVAVAVPLVELAAVVGLLAVPGNVVTAVCVAGLGLAFAGAGLVAVRRGERIRCACFGQPGNAELGWRQLAALPAWLGVAAVSLATPIGPASGTAPVAAAALTVATLVVIRELLPLARRNGEYLNVMEDQARSRLGAGAR